MRKFLVVFTFLVAIAGGVYFFRGPLAVKGVEWALSRALPLNSEHQLHYESAHFDQGRLIVRGLQLVEDNISFLVDEAEITMELDLPHFRFLGHAQLSHPQVSVKNRGKFPLETLAKAITLKKRFSMSAEASGGVLQMGEQRYFFQLSTGENSRCVISQDPSLLKHPFLIIQWSEKGEKTALNIEVHPIAIDRVSDLIAFSMPIAAHGWQPKSGTVEMRAGAMIDTEGNVENYSAHFSIEQLELTHGELSLKAERLLGELSSVSGVSLKLSDGQIVFEDHVYCNELAVSRTSGQFAKWELEGTHETLGRITFEGMENKGRAEGALYFSAIDSMASLIVVPFEPNGYLLTFNVHDWKGAQADLFLKALTKVVPSFSDLHVKQGEISAECSLAIENGQLSSIDLENLLARDVCLNLMNKNVDARLIKGQGRFTLDGDGEMLIDVTGSLGFPVLSDSTRLTSSVKMKKGSKEVSGAAQLAEGSIQFGFESRRLIPRRLEDIFEGWVRADHLSPSLYGPLVSAFNKDLEIEGVFDLFGTFDGEKLDLSLQADELFLHHPWADLKALGIGEKDQMLLRTDGRATLTYHLSNRCFQVHLPLNSASLYQRHTGLVFDHMTGMFSIHHDPENHSFSLDTAGANAFFDGKALLTELKSCLRGEFDSGCLVFEDFKARVALPTEEEYYLVLPSLKKERGQWDLQALLLDAKKTTLAQMQIASSDSIHGDLSLGKDLPLSGNLCFEILFDKAAGSMAVACDTQELMQGEKSLGEASLRVKNQNGNWQVESLKVGKAHFKGIFSPREEGWHFSQVQTNFDGLFAQGSGMLFVDFSEEMQPFSIRSELNFDAELHRPLPLQLHTTSPVKIAYSPSMGVVISNLDLEVGSSKLFIECLEGSAGKQKWHAHKCRYLLQNGLLRSLHTHANLPELVRALNFPEKMEGSLNFDWNKGSVKISGKEGAKQYHFQLSSPNLKASRSWELNLQEDSCILGGWVKENAITLEKIKGEIAGQKLDLKGAQSGRALVGTAIVDFKKLGSLATLPKVIEETELGEGFKLDGEFSILPGKTLGFKGRWRGKDFSAFGYHLRSMDAKAELLPGQLKLENCIVSDDAGKIVAPNILFSGRKFEIPKLELQDFQPSFLRAISGPETLPSTLIVKTATIESLSGSLDHPETIQGQGSFSFRGSPIPALRLPQGIEKALAIPVTGKADFTLREGKCFFTSLRECYSEKKRSAFTLGQAFCDFEGNLFIDFLLQEGNKQPMPFQLRGTKENPEMRIAS